MTRADIWRRASPSLAIWLALVSRPAWAMEPCPDGQHPSRWGLVIAAGLFLIVLALAFAVWSGNQSPLGKIGAVALTILGALASVVFLGFWAAVGPCVP